MQIYILCMYICHFVRCDILLKKIVLQNNMANIKSLVDFRTSTLKKIEPGIFINKMQENMKLIVSEKAKICRGEQKWKLSSWCEWPNLQSREVQVIFKWRPPGQFASYT